MQVNPSAASAAKPRTAFPQASNFRLASMERSTTCCHASVRTSMRFACCDNSSGVVLTTDGQAKRLSWEYRIELWGPIARRSQNSVQAAARTVAPARKPITLDATQPSRMALATLFALVMSRVMSTPNPAVRMVALVSANRTQLDICSNAWKAPSAVSFFCSLAGRTFGELLRHTGLDSLHGPSSSDAPLGVGGKPVSGPRGSGGSCVNTRIPVAPVSDAKVAVQV